MGTDDDNKLLERITQTPGQCGGKPCVRGMRIRVVDVIGMLAAGMTNEQVLTDFPELEPEDIRACLLYALRRVSHAQVAA